MAILIRVLIAAVCAVLALILVVPFFTLIGFVPPSELVLIIKVVIAALAIFYVVTGRYSLG